jgi:glycosyltransferase involved in cell wall biosynthesis
MRVALYAPLKAPGHPVPSGDRLMARQIMAALGRAGHDATVASSLRAYLRDPGDASGLAWLREAAAAERLRLAQDWRSGRAPELWLAYHPYYKAPDLIGPDLCAQFGVHYVTVETSYSARRNIGVWDWMQAQVLRGAQGAAVNICLTARDEAGLCAADAGIRTARLAPFIDLPDARPATPEPGHLVTVAMMRPGDKMDSYRHLAAALALLPGDWRLSVAGDGAMGPEVRARFAPFGARIRFLGQLDPPGVADLLARGAVYVWPGCAEAYGLAYLEAQAAGLPVVAFRTAGVPEVVADGETGLLTDPGDAVAHAAAIGRLLADDMLRSRMGQAAQGRVVARHSLPAAAATLDAILRQATGGREC